jgi:hypothetical protein
MPPRTVSVALLVGALCIALLYFVRSEVSLRVDSAALLFGEVHDGAADAGPAPQTANEHAAATALHDGPNEPPPGALPTNRANENALTPTVSTARVLEMWDARGITAAPMVRETDSAFAADPVDSPWARQREAEILGEIARTAGLQLVTVEVECRTSICRIQLTQRLSLQEAQERFRSRAPDPIYTKLMPRIGFTLSAGYPTMVASDGYGTTSRLLYVGRERNATESGSSQTSSDSPAQR